MNTFGHLLVLAAMSAASLSAQAFVATRMNPTITDAAYMTGDPSSPTWQYAYTITSGAKCEGEYCEDYTSNGVPLGWSTSTATTALGIADFRVPYFSDAQITDILSPANWSFEVMAQDTFSLGHGAMTLRWYTSSPLPLGFTQSGFGYTAGYSAGKGPFEVSSKTGMKYIGDPLIPLSPLAAEAGILPAQPSAAPIPEPQTYALMLVGLAVMATVARQRRA